eukprot:scaffold3075_cov62-Cyclotella_meneghiniana.AAC.6
MHSVNSNLADEEADELRSLSTMDTLTFRRLRDGRQRKKSKQSDNEDDHDGDDGVSSVSKLTFASRDSSSRRRMNIRTIHNNNNDDNDDDGESRMGDTLTTLTNASGGSRWSRYRGNGSSSRGGRNSRGEASVANTSRRCIVDICLLAVLGIVLFVKFGSVELELRGNLSKLRGGTVDAVDSSSHYNTDGAGYAQMLARQGNLQEYDGTDNLKRNNDHDEAEEFFDRAIHDLKNGVVPAQVNESAIQAQIGESNQQGSVNNDQPAMKIDGSAKFQTFDQASKALYENAQSSNSDLMDTQSISVNTNDASIQPQPPRAPEFQSFEQAQIQHQLQQAIVQQQQQALSQQQLQSQSPGADPLHPNNILDTHQQQLNHLMSEAAHHGEDGFKLNAQHLTNNDQQPPMHQSLDNTESVVEISPITSHRLQIATWNIAAINNNPFEYWITYDENPEYEKIMTSIEEFLESPGEKDVTVSNVFTEEMFSQLEKRMDGVGWDNVRSYWEGDFKERKIISGFMKDPLLGSKRLASMPDRISNTINVVGSEEPVCRPTVINMYDGDLSTLDLWWSAWEKFMFDTALSIEDKGEVTTNPVYKMLQPIKKAKYPDITEEEEKVSLPLQTMCGAIFDAILVHMMNTVSTPEVWQSLKKTMVENLNKNKVPRTLDILEKVYGTSDIITLQEVSGSLINQSKNRALGDKYWIVAPGDLDAVRDQNSVIFLSKTTFPSGPSAEITSVVEGSFEEGVDVPIAKGDILAITATDRNNIPYVIASFHGGEFVLMNGTY